MPTISFSQPGKKRAEDRAKQKKARRKSGAVVPVITKRDKLRLVVRRALVNKSVNIQAKSTTLALVTYTTPGLGQTNPDSVPDAFTFTDQTEVTEEALIVSNWQQIKGFTTSPTVTISGTNNPEYQIDSQPWTNVSGTINLNQSIRVRHTAASFPGISVDTVLTIGGVSDTFTSTTEQPSDIIPDQFTFTDQFSVNLSAQITSDPVIITGITAPTPISISGDASSLYSINGGLFTAAAGNVNNNDSVRARHTSSSSNSTIVNSTLDVNGVVDTFSSTTRSAATSTLMGINTAPGAYFEPSMPYINIAKGAFVEYSGQTPDSNGYVQNDGTWQLVVAAAFTKLQPGEFVLKWSGTSDCTWDQGSQTSSSANRRVYNMTSEQTGGSRITITNGTCSDIVLCRTIDEARYDAGEIVSSLYLADLAGCTIWRSMQLQDMNPSERRDFSDYLPYDYVTWSYDDRFIGPGGRAFRVGPRARVLAQMANELDVELWYTMPPPTNARRESFRGAGA